ncbi:S53 family peptidase [Trinickia acidisoli]|uniref:S53 family peptidase n=1 Tax=Trinickia acidisoli TaxID=2767482 RepID=UPI001A8F9872|nr:S53 family peptidase [Trinickia acidisoli]
MANTVAPAAAPSGRRELQGSAKRIRKGANRMRPEDPATPIEISVYLRHPPGAAPLHDMDYFAANAFGPREHMSREELNRRYAATADDLQAVTKFAQANKLSVISADPKRRLVRLAGNVETLGNAFAVQLFQYKTDHETYRGHEGTIKLPAEIADVVVGVFGLDNRRMARRVASVANVDSGVAVATPPKKVRRTVRLPEGGGGGAGTITPPQVAQAYNFPSPTAGAVGQTVAVLEFSGPLSQSLPTCGFAQSDIDGYINFLNTTTGTHLQSATVTAVAVDHSTDAPGNVPGGSATNFNALTDADVEVALDLEVIASVAQGAKVVAYFAPQTEQGWVDAITAIVADTTHDPDVLSISWGWSELEAQAGIDSIPGNWPFEWTQQAYQQLTQAFQAAANIGMTVFVSSGDQGSDCQEDDGKAHVLYPGSDPWVTCCGGTIVNSLSPLTEGTWNDNALGGGATGGGVSYLVGTQSWQANANVPASANNDGHHGRGLPDIAGNASPQSGYLLWLYGTRSDQLAFTAPPFLAGEDLGPVGGTSAVGPLYASLAAQINAILDTRIGYLNPTLYALGGSSVFRDINDGISNAVTTASDTTSPGYTSTAGWDACTGWGSVDGTALLGALRPIYQRATTLILDRSTFGRDEVNAQGSTANFPDAVYVVADGFSAQQLGLNSGNLDNPPLGQTLAFAGTFAALSGQGVALVFDDTTGVQLESPNDFQGPQRITFPFNVQFTSQQAFANITTPPGYMDFTLSATVSTIASGGVPSVSATSGTAELELVLQADPFMNAGETWWLSDDMRVFSVTPATLQGQSPLAYSTTPWPSDGSPNTYIANLLTELNTSFTDPTLPNTPFTGISPQEDQSQLQLNGSVSGNAVYNFGLARVHLQGDTAMNVRTFFRLFISPSPDTDFNTSTTFREAVQTDASNAPIAGTLIPLIGFPSNDMTATIPFFAAARIDPTAHPQTYQTDAANVQQIPSPLAPTPPTGAQVIAYFGCYLDINQTTPAFPLDPTTEANANGPWPAASLSSINQIIMSNHACLVAEVAYDPDPIPSGANAATSDKLGQRNLSWVGSDNPGALASHRVPTLFDLRPSAAVHPSRQQPPDELMIDWGNTPMGSTAAIYWPQVAANDVVALADELYLTHRLKQQDAHTIICKTGDVTYVPIPSGSSQRFAGLITIDLPSTVRSGQQFEIVVKRITSAQSSPLAAQSKRGPNWRYVVGAFQINVPVSKASALLPKEESLLAVFKWKLENLPFDNRWHPVLERYLRQITGRVDALGGNAPSIPASPQGYPVQGTQGGTQGGKGGTGANDLEFCGKVTGLIYDRFGDFDGFALESESGTEEHFRCEERAIEDLVRRAWLERYLIVVIARHAAPRVPISIVTRRAMRVH